MTVKTYTPRLGGRYIRDPDTGACVREEQTNTPANTPANTPRPPAEKAHRAVSKQGRKGEKQAAHPSRRGQGRSSG